MTLAAVFPPMPTPYADGEVDARAIASNVRRWIGAGLGGVVALGTNGEAGLLDEDESDRVVSAAREAIPTGRLLIVGTGRESTRATIAATRRAAALGADFVLVRTPSFFRNLMTPAALVRHFTAVADASAVPILLYNFPGQTGINFAPDTISRLAEHGNIAGVKETGTDAAQVAAFVDAAPAPFSVLSGAGPGFYAALCVGAAGGVLAVACVVPELCIRLHALAAAGQHAEARALQRSLTPIANLITTIHGVPGLKAALDLAGYIGGVPRPPLAPLAPDARARIEAELTRLQEVV
jgi:4-hydroxy-2-oxoglutarate aldolase